MFEERRRTPRRQVHQIGMIFAPREAASYCLVTDRSDGGVQIRTRSDFEPPSDFVLRLGNTDFRYSVVWRKGSVIGAKVVR